MKSGDSGTDHRSVTFVIPFRAKATCGDWKSVSAACLGTVRSILAQTNGAWRCILCCHDVPDDLPRDERISIIQVDLPIPSSREGYRGDKREKIMRGVAEYLERGGDFYMVLDADDRVHRGLVDHVVRGSSRRYLVTNGYVYNGGPFVRHHRRTFDRLCGSVSVGSIDDARAGLIVVTLGHHRVAERYRSLGLEFETVPFPAVVKNVAYGGNKTETRFLFSERPRRTLRKALMMRPLTRAIKRDFALDTNP